MVKLKPKKFMFLGLYNTIRGGVGFHQRPTFLRWKVGGIFIHSPKAYFSTQCAKGQASFSAPFEIVEKRRESEKGSDKGRKIKVKA